jgi:hypothetical protein
MDVEAQALTHHPTAPTSTNTAPTASQDIATTLNNAVISIDVLANDSDPESDSLTITEIVTEPSFGTAAIVNNQIEFTPQENFAGSDSITYRISDGELTAEADITLTLSQSLTLSGTLTDLNGTDATLSILVGENNEGTQVPIDSNGEFGVLINVDDTNLFVQLIANNAEQQPLLRSLLGNVEQLIEQSGEDRVLTPRELTRLNLNLLSTAFSLIVEDLNENQPFEESQSFENAISSVNAQDALNIAAFMQLITTNNDFIFNENITALSLLNNNEQPTTQDVIQQYLANNELLDNVGDPFINYQNALEEAISIVVSNLPTNSGIEDLANNLVNRPLLALPAQQAGFIVPDADSYTLHMDGTGTYFPFTNSIRGSVDSSTDFTWAFEDDRLQLALDRVLLESLPPITSRFSLEFITIAQQYGIEVANLLLNNPGAASSTLVRINETGRTFSLVDRSGSQIQAIIETRSIRELVLPDSLGFGPNPVFTPIPEVTSVSIPNTGESLFSALSQDELEGEWLLPLTMEAESGFETLIREKVTLNSDGSASGSFNEREYSWSLSAGILSLTRGNERYEFEPFLLNGKEYQVRLTRFIDNQITLQQSSTIAQFDDSFTEFTDNIVTELPLIYNAHIASTLTDSWVGNTLRPSRIFGYNFDNDGTVFSSILTANDAFIPFRDENWIQTENNITIESNSLTSFSKRDWEIVSVDEDDRVIVWERRITAFDSTTSGNFPEDSFNLVSPPRMNILTQLDLSQYPEILERSNFLQGNQNNINEENANTLRSLD